MKQLKTNFSLPILVIVLIISVFLVGVDQARAAVTYSEDTTWNADVGNITIEANSTATTVTTTNVTMTISLVSGDKIVLNSAAGLQLSNDGGHTYTCDAS